MGSLSQIEKKKKKKFGGIPVITRTNKLKIE